MEGCSHARSWEYFRESINRENKFYAVSCSSWLKYITKSCKGDEHVIMGDPVLRNVSGSFYLETEQKEPYALRKVWSLNFY